MNRLETVLITGASRGLGLALANSYAAEGFYVIACARNTFSINLQKLKEEYKDNLYIVPLDVASTDSVEKASVQVGQAVAGIDIIINNAAIHAEDSSLELEKANIDNCLEVYNVNTLGALRVAKAFLPLLEQGHSKILVNISSEAGSIANCYREKEFDYCMSKAAMNMQSKLLQNHLKTRDIKVLAIHPGWMRTDMGGPDADLAPIEAANSVRSIVEKYRSGQSSQLYIDNQENVLPF